MIKVIKEPKKDKNDLDLVIVQGGNTAIEDYSPINKMDIKKPEI